MYVGALSNPRQLKIYLQYIKYIFYCPHCCCSIVRVEDGASRDDFVVAVSSKIMVGAVGAEFNGVTKNRAGARSPDCHRS